MENALKQIVTIQKSPKAIGIYSACSANPFVVEAVLKKGYEDQSCVLIEATANQCNQYGGYTGMKPIDFKNMVLNIADKVGLNKNKIFLGGDHLGPLTWTFLNEKEAMSNAEKLVTSYVSAGFSKIHIDTSMKLKDDDLSIRLSDETIARRGIYLIKKAEQAYKELKKLNKDAIEPVYIIGSEVPIPGGSQNSIDNSIQITKVSDFMNTINTYKTLFDSEGLSEVWNRVIGIVVQPGVEENDNGCHEYDHTKALNLTNTIKKIPNLVFEGHSTDYQTKFKLREMVEDGIAILKVGPALTFALREALFALSFIEDEVCKVSTKETSSFRKILDEEMLKNNTYWQKYYYGSEKEVAFKRAYSFSDRSRYYYQTKSVLKAINILLNNLKDGCPLSLLSQFMPIQYTKVREGKLSNSPKNLILDRIGNTIDEYLYATCQKELF